MRKLALVAVATASMLLFPSVASAKTLFFDGTATNDFDTHIAFDAKGKKKKGKFKAKTVSNIAVENQAFICYKADGSPSAPLVSGRDTSGAYTAAYLGIDPVEVKKNGKFSGSDSFTIGSGPYTLYRVEFEGKIKGRKGNKATGTYQTKYAAGGIEFGYCGDKEPVEWDAEGSFAARPLPE